MKLRWSDLWRWDGDVGRSAYVAWGLFLFAIKFALDCAMSTHVFNRHWSPFNYLFPGRVFTLASHSDVAFCLTMLAVAMPFVWVGVALTLRRLRGAGLPLWLVVLFFVPMLSLLFFAILSALPNRDQHCRVSVSRVSLRLRRLLPRSSVGSALLGVIVTALFGLGMMVLSVEVFQSYGWGLFVMVPFSVGLIAVLIYGANETKRYWECVGVACLAVTMIGVLFLFFALEGLICILMAAPLAVPLAILGGSVGYLIQRRGVGAAQAVSVSRMMAVALPALLLAEHMGNPNATLLQVRSAVVVNADAATVWRHVVEFSELPAPTEWVFRVGIAYPIRAQIAGSGLGAVRKCVFSTGAFVEPIEVWDEPRLLRFGVTSNPPPMEEWSPYQRIHPPHLDGFLVSERGQFLLTPMPGGRTCLEGTTWYRHHMWPERYWQWWSDYIIHRIHLRVLEHIKRRAESVSSM